MSRVPKRVKQRRGNAMSKILIFLFALLLGAMAGAGAA
jgi:hypothetical protein